MFLLVDPRRLVRRTMYVELEKSLLRNTLCPGNWLFAGFARASGDKRGNSKQFARLNLSSN